MIFIFIWVQKKKKGEKKKEIQRCDRPSVGCICYLLENFIHEVLLYIAHSIQTDEAYDVIFKAAYNTICTEIIIIIKAHIHFSRRIKLYT